MFEKTSRLAEKLATNVSRRHFLGALGRWAGTSALAVAGILTSAGPARADTFTCCVYWCSKNGLLTGYTRCLQGAVTCEPPKAGCALVKTESVFDCQVCAGKKGTGGGA
jgi:hypothetical protein